VLDGGADWHNLTNTTELSKGANYYFDQLFPLHLCHRHHCFIAVQCTMYATTVLCMLKDYGTLKCTIYQPVISCIITVSFCDYYSINCLSNTVNLEPFTENRTMYLQFQCVNQ